MDVGNSVRLAIDDWERGELDAAMLHACNAVDGTARRVLPGMGSKARFTKLLRDNYKILGPMGAPGVDLDQTRFPVMLDRSPTAPGGKPDLADVIYGIHRCCHGHGEALPAGFELLADAAGPAAMTRLVVTKGTVALSDRIIFGLLGVAVLSPINVDQSVPAGYHLTFGAGTTLPLSEWWGRASDFQSIADREAVPAVVLDFGDWMIDM